MIIRSVAMFIFEYNFNVPHCVLYCLRITNHYCVIFEKLPRNGASLSSFSYYRYLGYSRAKLFTGKCNED